MPINDELSREREGAFRGPDYEDQALAMRTMRTRHRYEAVIKSASTEINHGDEYRVDVYADGIKFDSFGNITNDPTIFNVPAFYLGTNIKSFPVDKIIKVNFFNDVALILPQEIPEDSGFGKVLMIVDNNGSWQADYPRFNSKFTLLDPDEEAEESPDTTNFPVTHLP